MKHVSVTQYENTVDICMCAEARFLDQLVDSSTSWLVIDPAAPGYINTYLCDATKTSFVH